MWLTLPFIDFVGSGIGRHLCEAYARAGCKAIALADLNAKGIQETAALLKANGFNVQILEIEVDVTSEASVRNMISKTVECFGSIDYGMFSVALFQSIIARSAFLENQWNNKFSCQCGRSLHAYPIANCRIPSWRV
jgi:NAD(P)-dependent dehydrogenase (short-subunit alcohol dehydrogenase family)